MGIGWRHPHYAELLERQPALDFIEVHSENFFAPGGAALAVLREGRDRYPVSLHGVGLSLGSAGGIDEWHLDQLERLVHAIDPVRISDHASFARGTLPGVDGTPSPASVHAADLLPVPFSHEALDVMCANVQRVQDRLQRPIAVENLSAYLRWQHADMSETQFLSTLVQRTGCTLLVDVNNIYVNALNAQLLGEPGEPLQICREWLDQIPGEAVAEIHLAGHIHCGDIVIDDHGSRVSEPVWTLYRHAIARFGAVPTLIEWDTGVPPLDRAARRGGAGARSRHIGAAAHPQQRHRAPGGAGMTALAQQQQALLGTLAGPAGQRPGRRGADRPQGPGPCALGAGFERLPGQRPRSGRAFAVGRLPRGRGAGGRRQLCHDGARTLAPSSARARRSGLLGRGPG